jgi:hypothetical protein
MHEFKVRRVTYRFKELPNEFNNYDTAFFLELYKSTKIDERIVKLKVNKEEMKLSVGDEGKFSEIYEAKEGDFKDDEKKLIIKIPKKPDNPLSIDPRLDKAKSFARMRAKSTLIACLISRLWRFKSAFIQKREEAIYIPQIFYPSPIIYEILDDELF